MELWGQVSYNNRGQIEISVGIKKSFDRGSVLSWDRKLD